MSTIGTDLDRHIACLLDKQKDGSSLCYSVFTYGRPSIQSVIRYEGKIKKASLNCI